MVAAEAGLCVLYPGVLQLEKAGLLPPLSFLSLGQRSLARGALPCTCRLILEPAGQHVLLFQPSALNVRSGVWGGGRGS